MSALAGGPRVSRVNPPDPRVLVLINDLASVPSNVVDHARTEVCRLFALIGVEIVWVSDVPPAGTRLRIVTLVTWEPSPNRLPASILGYVQTAPGKSGVMAYVFWPRVQRTSQDFTVRLDNLLAAAVAHEIGHMLLPEGWHAEHGLMQADWNANHLRAASDGLLCFSPETGALIRERLESK